MIKIDSFNHKMNEQDDDLVEEISKEFMTEIITQLKQIKEDKMNEQGSEDSEYSEYSQDSEEDLEIVFRYSHAAFKVGIDISTWFRAAKDNHKKYEANLDDLAKVGFDRNKLYEDTAYQHKMWNDVVYDLANYMMREHPQYRMLFADYLDTRDFEEAVGKLFDVFYLFLLNDEFILNYQHILMEYYKVGEDETFFEDLRQFDKKAHKKYQRCLVVRDQIIQVITNIFFIDQLPLIDDVKGVIKQIAYFDYNQLMCSKQTNVAITSSNA